MLIAPRPSRLAGRASRLTRWLWRRRNSAASSMVMMRSPSGMKFDSRLRKVVLPEPVPPETTMLRRCSTQMRRNPAISCEREPRRTRSSTSSARRANLRMVSVGPLRASGGMIALTREPSRRRASTIGEDSSMRRPSGATMRSMTPSTARSLVKVVGCGAMRPPRSTKIWSKRLTMISLTASSASRVSSGPRPIASSRTSRHSRSRSSPGGSEASAAMISHTSAVVSLRSSSSDMRLRSRRRRSMVSSRRSWMRLRQVKPAFASIAAGGGSTTAQAGASGAGASAPRSASSGIAGCIGWGICRGAGWGCRCGLRKNIAISGQLPP